MSGLKNEPRKGGNFVNFKKGKLVNVGEDGVKNEYTGLTGHIVNLDVTDEKYNGDDYRKITLFIKDDEGTIWKLGFPLESGYGDSFCSIAPNIDFTKELTISGGIKELESGKEYGSVYVSQDGKNLKWALKKGDKPEGEKIRGVSGLNYVKKNDFLYAEIIENIRPAIVAASGADADEKPKAKKAK